jgi:uncharacterized protein YjbJ (UPF0337 family)
MKWNEIERDWKGLKAQFRTKWNKLTDADLTAIAGKRDELVNRLYQHYKSDKRKLEKEVDEFIAKIKPATV